MARLKRDATTFFRIFSRGCPFFSYSANRKNGIITAIIRVIRRLPGSLPLVRKYSGMPISAPLPKQMICRFVRPKASLVLICVRSFGTSA